jgi:class 3 adenylate cyclase
VEIGDVRYARAGDHHIAWRQLVGGQDGEHEIVMVSGGYFPMESLLRDPVAKRLLEGLAALGRLVVFDRRGIALSDPISDWTVPPSEQWAEDLAAVIDASEFDLPVVFSWSQVPVARRYAITHPERLSHLLLFNPSSPAAATDRAWLDAYLRDLRNLQAGEGDRLMSLVWPGRWRDPGFRDWLAESGRFGASPSEAARFLDWATHEYYEPGLDHGLLTTPTMVMTRGGSVAPEEYLGRAAQLIPGAFHVSLSPGSLMAIGAGVDEILAAITNHLTGQTRLPPPERLLAAILVTDIVASTERAELAGDTTWKNVLDHHDEISRRIVERAGGQVVKFMGDGVLAILPSATSAVRAATDLRERLAEEDLDVRAGIHAGEIDRRGDDVSGLAVHIVARVAAAAGPGQILATDTVARFAEGASFDSIGVRGLKGTTGGWELFELSSDS